MSTIESASKKYNVKVIMSVGEKLYLSEEMADFHFVFESADGRCERIPAHKLLLATASDVFRAMFNGDWIEKDVAKIVDVSPSAFKEFLQFIYLERVKVTAGNVAEVMNMGKKYDIPECVNACKDFLMSTLTSETVCLGYGPAILLDEKDLMKFCEEIIRSHASKVFASASFLDCDRKVLSHILKLDSLCCTAAEMIEASMSWVKSASQEENLTRELVQEHLGNLFYEIPFGSMSLGDFAAFDRSYKHLFTIDEHSEIIQMIASDVFQSKMFTANRKIFSKISVEWNQDAVVSCNRSLAAVGPYFIKNIEKTTFTTSGAVLLGTIIFEDLSEYRNGWYKFIENVVTKIEIIENNKLKPSAKGSIVYSDKAHLKSKSQTRILLSEPVIIKPGLIYEIKMEQQPPANCCTRLSLKSKVEMESGIIVKFHHSNEGTDEVMRGLIWKLEFNLIQK